MLRSTTDLGHYTVSATDGDVGTLKDLYFDDDAWVIRYFVVETGSWLTSKQVLISPISVHHPSVGERNIPVAITKDQVRHSPDIDTNQPVSRQNEEDYLGYYGYSAYWGGAGLWGEGLYPGAMVPGYQRSGMDRAARIQEEEAHLKAEKERHRNDDPHLRSCKSITGYRIHVDDGDIGQVAGFLVDDETWAIRYIVVETGHWWAGHQVLIAPRWTTGVHWSDQTVTVDLTRDSVRGAPPYDPAQPWTSAHDLHLYRHHGRARYWDDRGALEPGF